MRCQVIGTWGLWGSAPLVVKTYNHCFEFFCHSFVLIAIMGLGFDIIEA